ncbi:MAG: PHP domain-containing protein [Thermoplasmatales archaeon]|nr:MAG: PHP domain-containing protein [Thermoplasmatales archaeon]
MFGVLSMIKLDLHIHSQYSEDALGSIKEIIKLIQKKGLHGVAFTDHNTVDGGVRALKIAPKGFIVIPGTEISTADGHILALNVKENINKGLSVEETVENIIDLGGTPIVPHIFRNMSGIKKEKLKKIYKKIPAIEVFNSCSVPKTNLKTTKVAKHFNLGGTGGSDSHDLQYVGYAYTIVNSTDMTVDSVISEIDKKKTWGEGIVMPIDYRKDRMIISVKQFFQRGFKRI